jgi:hypothetical protein
MKTGIEFEKRNGVDYAYVHGPITDVHMHPRLFDTLVLNGNSVLNGKAGAEVYSKAALLSGIYRGLAMGNETARIFNPDTDDQTETFPYPINNIERLVITAQVIGSQSYMEMGINMVADRSIIGLDEDTPQFSTHQIEKIYSSRYVDELAAGLKIYGAETTGGYNIPLEYVIPVSEVWFKNQPAKPITLHLEDEAVEYILRDWPDKIPVHIAHVSSWQELESVIVAKQNGKNVTCEATPHHMTLTELTRNELGGLGCVKPSLKTAADVKYLREHKEYIDYLASDCAPHRPTDKEGPNPAFGLANHAEFMSIWFQAIEEGWLSATELYKKLVSGPMERYNLPWRDMSAEFLLKPVTAAELASSVDYGCDPFLESSETPPLRGKLTSIKSAGRLAVRSGMLMDAKPRYDNLIVF